MTGERTARSAREKWDTFFPGMDLEYLFAVEAETGKGVGMIETMITASFDLECLDHAAALMLHLGDMLSSNEKIRVTIERNPETGICTMKREILH